MFPGGAPNTRQACGEAGDGKAAAAASASAREKGRRKKEGKDAFRTHAPQPNVTEITGPVCSLSAQCNVCWATDPRGPRPLPLPQSLRALTFQPARATIADFFFVFESFALVLITWFHENSR